jgi:hypothetical protein
MKSPTLFVEKTEAPELAQNNEIFANAYYGGEG